MVDFKSNWIGQERVREVGASYDVQLRLYAWAMAREFGLPVAKAQAYFLIPNQLYSLEPALLDADQTEKWLIQTCASILQGAEAGVEAFQVGSDCNLCAQNSYCMMHEGRMSQNGEDTGIGLEGAEEEKVV